MRLRVKPAMTGGRGRIKKGLIMEKVLKNIWRIACYPMLYMGVQIVVSVIYIFIYIIFYVMKLVIENINTAFDFKPDEITRQILAPENILIPLLISVAVTFLILYLILKKEWAYDKLFSFGKLRASSVVMCVLFGIAFSFFIDGALTLFFGILPIKIPEQPIDDLIGGNLILELLSVGILGPFLEEVIFRGIVQKRLTQMMDITAAIILQGFIFGLIHFNILQSSYAAVIGLALGLIYYWTESIWPAVAVHIIFNTTSVVMSYIIGDGVELNLMYYIVITFISLVISLLILYILYKKRTVKKPAYNRWAF